MQARSELFLMFERAGFTLVRCNKHAIWRCPCGHTQIVTSTTPGEGRASRNADALRVRTLNACNQLRRTA